MEEQQLLLQPPQALSQLENQKQEHLPRLLLLGQAAAMLPLELPALPLRQQLQLLQPLQQTRRRMLRRLQQRSRSELHVA